MIYKKTFFAIVITMLMAFAPMAQSADLTKRQIENYIASAEEFNGMEEEFDIFDEDDGFTLEDLKDGPPKMVLLVEQAKGKPDYPKIEAVVKRNGFKNMMDWAQVADRVNAAAMYLMMDVDRSELVQQMESAKKEVEAMTGLSDAQKEFMLSMATAGMDILDGWVVDVPEADVKAVEPYLERFMKMVEEG